MRTLRRAPTVADSNTQEAALANLAEALLAAAARAEKEAAAVAAHPQGSGDADETKPQAAVAGLAEATAHKKRKGQPLEGVPTPPSAKVGRQAITSTPVTGMTGIIHLLVSKSSCTYMCA